MTSSTWAVCAAAALMALLFLGCPSATTQRGFPLAVPPTELQQIMAGQQPRGIEPVLTLTGDRLATLGVAELRVPRGLYRELFQSPPAPGEWTVLWLDDEGRLTGWREEGRSWCEGQPADRAVEARLMHHPDGSLIEVLRRDGCGETPVHYVVRWFGPMEHGEHWQLTQWDHDGCGGVGGYLDRVFVPLDPTLPAGDPAALPDHGRSERWRYLTNTRHQFNDNAWDAFWEGLFQQPEHPADDCTGEFGPTLDAQQPSGWSDDLTPPETVPRGLLEVSQLFFDGRPAVEVLGRPAPTEPEVWRLTLDPRVQFDLWAVAEGATE